MAIAQTPPGQGRSSFLPSASRLGLLGGSAPPGGTRMAMVALVSLAAGFVMGNLSSFSLSDSGSPMLTSHCSLQQGFFSIAGFGGGEAFGTPVSEEEGAEFGASAGDKGGQASAVQRGGGGRLAPNTGQDAMSAGAAAVLSMTTLDLDHTAEAGGKRLGGDILSGRARGITCEELNLLRHKMVTYLTATGLKNLLGHMDVEVLLPIIAGAWGGGGWGGCP